MPQILGSKLPEWRLLVDNLEPYLGDIPHAEADHEALAEVVRQGQQLEAEQEICKARLREVNQRRAELVVAGRGVRNRLAATVQGTFGLESEKLIGFGLKPRARAPRLNRPSKAKELTRAAEETGTA